MQQYLYAYAQEDSLGHTLLSNGPTLWEGRGEHLGERAEPDAAARSSLDESMEMSGGLRTPPGPGGGRDSIYIGFGVAAVRSNGTGDIDARGSAVAVHGRPTHVVDTWRHLRAAINRPL